MDTAQSNALQALPILASARQSRTSDPQGMEEMLSRILSFDYRSIHGDHDELMARILCRATENYEDGRNDHKTAYDRYIMMPVLGG